MIEKPEPVAALTIDCTGCEHLSLDVANIQRIAASGSEGQTAVHHLYDAATVAALVEEVERLGRLNARLITEAQIHAQEARTANATIAEIYQAISGATGEPGNWNGAKPVRAYIAAAEARATAAEQLLAEAREALGWYAEQAEAMARHSIIINASALEAAVTCISLDGGDRARATINRIGGGDE